MLAKNLLARSFSTAAAANNRVGMIGLGNMGIGMATNMASKGWQVKGLDINEANRQKAAENGITPVTTIAECVKDVDFVVFSLPRTGDVEGVLMGDDGVFANANPNTFIADTSTISPIAAKEFAETAKRHDMRYIDAPVSGGTIGATNGTLTFMCGAESEADFEHVKICLELMGQKFFNCGGPGTGEIAKLCNNLILGVQMASTAEGLALGLKLGIDPKILSDVISVSTGGSFSTRNYNPIPGVVDIAPSTNGYKGGFGVALANKDLKLAVDIANGVDADSTFCQLASDYFTPLEENGHGGKDFGYVFQYIMKNKKI